MNKKIKNATSVELSGLSLKSKLEETIYNTLVQLGFSPTYEKLIILVPEWESITPFYDRETKAQRNKRIKNGNGLNTYQLALQGAKIRPVTYSPDFYFNYYGIDVYIEAKGFENDVFPYKKKLFRKFLDSKFMQTGRRSIFFEVYSKAQLLQAIDIVREYEQSLQTNQD